MALAGLSVLQLPPLAHPGTIGILVICCFDTMCFFGLHWFVHVRVFPVLFLWVQVRILGEAMFCCANFRLSQSVFVNKVSHEYAAFTYSGLMTLRLQQYCLVARVWKWKWTKIFPSWGLFYWLQFERIRCGWGLRKGRSCRLYRCPTVVCVVLSRKMKV